jgi:hypothetical protein
MGFEDLASFLDHKDLRPNALRRRLNFVHFVIILNEP